MFVFIYNLAAVLNARVGNSTPEKIENLSGALRRKAGLTLFRERNISFTSLNRLRVARRHLIFWLLFVSTILVLVPSVFHSSTPALEVVAANRMTLFLISSTFVRISVAVVPFSPCGLAPGSSFRPFIFRQGNESKRTDWRSRQFAVVSARAEC